MDLNPVPLTLDPNACLIAWTSTLSNFITTLGWHPLHFFFVLPKKECCLPSLDHLHWAKLYHGRTFVGNPVGVFINPSQNTDFLNQALGGMHRQRWKGKGFSVWCLWSANLPMHQCNNPVLWVGIRAVYQQVMEINHRDKCLGTMGWGKESKDWSQSEFCEPRNAKQRARASVVRAEKTSMEIGHMAED